MNFQKNISTSFILKIILKVFSQKSRTDKIPHHPNFNILVITSGSIQEVLSVTPLIGILYKNVSISTSLLVDYESSHVVEKSQYLNKIFLLKNNLLERTKLLISLKRNKFDVIIDTTENITNEFIPTIVSLLSSNYKIGYYGIYDKIFTHKISRPPINQTHMIDRYLKLIEPFNLEFSKSDVNISYEPPELCKSEVEDYNIKHDLIFKFKLLINISNEKNLGLWNTDNYKRLIRFFKNFNLHITIGSSTTDYKQAEQISDGKYTIIYHDEFDRYASIIKKSDFVFSPDSFTVQLAGAYHVPAFCLFVQHETFEMINVPYNSDFDFALTEKSSLKDISYGKVLNSFIPFFDYVYEKFQKNK